MKNEYRSWEDWMDSSKSSIELFNGRLYKILKPDWHGSRNKGKSVFDFSGLELKSVSIYKAFAEGLTMRGATFKDVFFGEGDYSRADFSNCQFIDTKFNKTIFTNSIFTGATFRNCNLDRVNLTGAKFDVKEISETVVYGISAWDLEISKTSIQSKLVIEKTYELYSDIIKEGRIPTTVDNIELAQFIYFLSNHKNMRDTIDILNRRGVLLLGRFENGGLERLYELQNWFSGKNYSPMIFDFQRPKNLDYTETIITMSGLSKMIVADLSGDSVPHELYAIFSNFVKPLIVFGPKGPYVLSKDIKRKNRYFHEFKFDGTVADLISNIASAVEDAETDYQQIIIDLAKEYRK